MFDVLPLIAAIRAQLTLQGQDICVLFNGKPLVLLPAWISLLGKTE